MLCVLFKLICYVLLILYLQALEWTMDLFAVTVASGMAQAAVYVVTKSTAARLRINHRCCIAHIAVIRIGGLITLKVT